MAHPSPRSMPLEGLDLLPIPIVASTGGAVHFNAAADRLFRGASTATEDGAAVRPGDIATGVAEVDVIVVSTGEQKRIFSCHRRSSPDLAMTTFVDETVLRAERAACVDTETMLEWTTRRETEQRYREAWERARDFERVFQAAPTCQCIISFTGRFLVVNERWTEMLGYSKEELLAGPCFDLVHPDDVQKTEAAAEDLIREERRLVSFENRYRHRSGGFRWLRWYVISDLDAQKIYAVATDITDEKARSAELQRLASVADRTENGVVVTDPSTAIVWANPAFTKITGYELAEVLGKNPGQVLQGVDTDPEVVDKIREAVRRRRGVQTELINYRKDGSPFWVQLDIQPVFDDEGALIYFVSIETDVTAHKMHEEELRQARDAAEAAAEIAADANRAKSLFLANMSHEIRTPLNGVLGVAELLLDTQLAPRQRHFVETISRSGHALLTLLNDILDFSKIEANKLELETAPYALTEIVTLVADMMRVSAEKKGLKLTVNVPQHIPALLGDGGRIRQVILNLVSNAVKFTATGEVNIAVDAETSSAGAILTVRVTDTGTGIERDALKRLFRPFTQADASTTRQYGGTGLGLSICKNLVELMGGRIGVQSELGQGSVFWFRIAQSIATDGVATPRVAPELVDLKGCQVLLVEDNATNQLVAKGMLHRLGCEVDVADNGAEAVALATDRIYDVILMDCQMPRMDGYAATRAIRQLDAAISDVPIIALTASSMMGDEQRCREAGMSDYLSKPIRRHALAAKIGLHWPQGDGPASNSAS